MRSLCPGCGVWHESNAPVMHCRECWLGDSEARWLRSMRGANKYVRGIDTEKPTYARNK